jgi:hypothetical protein
MLCTVTNSDARVLHLQQLLFCILHIACTIIKGKVNNAHVFALEFINLSFQIGNQWLDNCQNV